MTSYQMKNDSNRVQLVGGWVWDLEGIFVALLIPWAQGYQGSQDKEKDSADLNRNAIPRSIFRICTHHLFVFFATRM